MQKHLTSTINKLKAVLAIFAAASCLAPSLAQAVYPDKPVRIIVPFAPGGGTDLIARTLGAGMSQELGQTVIIENKPGAGTIIGSDLVAKSPPDGYTIVIATFAHALNPSLQPKLPYATDKAFAPIMLIGRSPNVLVVRSDSPYKSVKDIIAAAKAKPKTLTFASQGNGTSAHLAGELFKNLARVDLTHVPYRGAGPALTDLLGGQVDMMFATAAAVGSFLDGGKLRALAVTTVERSPALANVPTIAESNVPGYAADSWYGLYAPAGTPHEVIAALNTAARKAVQMDTFRKRVEDEGLVISAGTPAELDRYVRAEEARWRKVVKENNITVD
ncbi:tripartite tricarboxylate transporter substrate binding protein [Polaromonas sp. UC242_47]|uniref:tripartite tricarboxylate transporter substrate binding protein n=1 Tax=Polaromonas sp. UC242_47 TaxID=3374626 RepID=UPI0037BC6F8A